MNVMLDLETYGVTPNSVILAICAIRFPLTTKSNFFEDVDETSLNGLDIFYRRIEIKTCLEKGMIIDEDTKKWWSSQKDSIKQEILYNKDRVSLKTALNDFIMWYNLTGVKELWANSPAFDCVIMENAFSKCGLSPPWKFYETRDLRTLVNLCRFKIYTSNYRLHDPRYDCYRQIVKYHKAVKYLTR